MDLQSLYRVITKRHGGLEWTYRHYTGLSRKDMVGQNGPTVSIQGYHEKTLQVRMDLQSIYRVITKRRDRLEWTYSQYTGLSRKDVVGQNGPTVSIQGYHEKTLQVREYTVSIKGDHGNTWQVRMHKFFGVLHLRLCSWLQKIIFIVAKTISVFPPEYRKSSAEINVKILHICGNFHSILAFRDISDTFCNSSAYWHAS